MSLNAAKVKKRIDKIKPILYLEISLHFANNLISWIESRSPIKCSQSICLLFSSIYCTQCICTEGHWCSRHLKFGNWGVQEIYQSESDLVLIRPTITRAAFLEVFVKACGVRIALVVGWLGSCPSGTEVSGAADILKLAAQAFHQVYEPFQF